MALIAEDLTGQIIRAAIEVHRELGPGLLESAYEVCLCHVLAQAGFRVERQVPVPVVFRGVKLECGYRIDLLVEDRVIVEVKAVSALEPVHRAQLMSHLRLADKRVGLLLNFHSVKLTDGLVRIVL